MKSCITKSRTVLSCLVMGLGLSALPAFADTVAITGTPTETLSPSADSLVLIANSLTTSIGTLFTLQTGTFHVGDSGFLSGSFPVTVMENVTVDGETLPITFTGTLIVTNPNQANTDSLSFGPQSVLFGTPGVTLTTNSYSSPAGGVGASFPITIKATLTTTATPEPSTLYTLGFGVVALIVGRKVYRRRVA
jgi:hypothetical protein